MRYKWPPDTSEYIEGPVIRHNLTHTVTGFRQGEF